MNRLVSALWAWMHCIGHLIPGLTAGAISWRPSGPLICLLVSTAAVASEPEIRLVQKGNTPVAIEAAGLPGNFVDALSKLPADDEAWNRTFPIYVGKSSQAQQPPIAGAYELKGNVLRFTPRFPLKGGLTYRAEVFLPAADRMSAPAHYEQVFTLPAPPRGKPAKVAAVYPSADVLPENHLRFYLHFSAPMSRGEAYDHLRLLKADGQPVEFAFLEIGEELWDSSGKRLTLLIDPGRIKRGLKPRELFGPVLEAGGKYTLVVTKGWHDASGQPLAEDDKKTFSAGPPVEAAIDHKAWKIAAPRALTREPLIVRFAQPLDHALLERTITIENAAGERIAGAVTVGKGEMFWEFRPDQPWNAGRHELVVDTTLEDTAGNRIGRPFEVDQFDQVDQGVVAEFVRLPLEIRASGR